MIANPYKTWKDVNAELPANKIEVLGPPPTSGTRDAFLELVMEVGAEKIDSLKALKKSDAKAFAKVFNTIREDGAYVEAGENDNLIIQKLQSNPNALGIFGFSFLDQNTDTVKGATIDGKAPTLRASPTVPIRSPVRSFSMSRRPMSRSFPVSKATWPSSPAKKPGARTATWPTRA
jgi:phosphate transport system substrate-binding protein